MALRVQWYGSQATRQIEGQIASRVKRAGKILADAVREECPVDTGDLRSTVRVEPGPDRFSVAVAVGDESRGIDYARYVHDGTSRSRANPFFARAVYRSMGSVRDALAGKGLGVLGRAAEAIGRIFGR